MHNVLHARHAVYLFSKAAQVIMRDDQKSVEDSYSEL